MSLILWIIIGIILACFLITTLWIFFNFLKNAKKDYNLYKSVFKSVFSRKLSLIIIVVFYLISFGLVGGLTSALGRLNVETTDYIKENHLHQGVGKQTSLNRTNPTYHTFDQKTFYLATQGVIDFYNDNLISEKENKTCPKETSFLNMLGGQAAIPGQEPTTKEKLDGSNSPLSYKNNPKSEENSVNGHNFSIHDIGQFWNTWYYKDFEHNDPSVGGSDSDGNSHWKYYRYNGEKCEYDLTKSHNNSPVIENIENILNSTLFYKEDNVNSDDNWTFEEAINDETNGLDTFSEVAYVFFDNDINKYLSTIGTYFFEYYLDTYLDSDNIFASSDVYEYQKTVLGTDFLLQSYNKNQLTNDKTAINNPGEDKNGNYAIDTVTFYDNKGKEVAGPSDSDEFFAPHEGTREDPYQIYVSAEYYEAHGLASDVAGGAKKLLTYDGPNNNGLYYEIKGSYRSPTYSFPMQTIYDSLQNPKENAAILINTQSLLRLTRGIEYSTTNYEFFGFSNIYDATKRSANWYFPSSDIKPTSNTYYVTPVELYFETLNSFYGDSSWEAAANSGIEGLSIPQTFYLNGETINSENSLISYRSYAIIREVYTDRIIYTVIMGIFLVITIIVLILLIRKRIQDSNKQIGTIKALGYGPGRIASAYTIFPIIIIFIGGALALAVALPLSLWFTSLYSGFFSLNLAVPYVGWVLWLKIFIVPLVISMFLGYWMAYRTIKRPTLDLLNNVGKDKPNWMVRGITPLIPSFSSFGFDYKIKGIGRAFGKSLLLFCAILGSMSITAFAFSSSTMTATMTKQVFDIIDYNSKQWEYGAPFIEDININDDDFVDQTTGEYIDMEAFDLFSGNKPAQLTLAAYVIDVLLNPNDALATFQTQYDKYYPNEDFNFKFVIATDTEGFPTVTSNYYIPWETAVALWATDLALHVPLETPDEDGNDFNEDLNESIIKGPTNVISFNMIDPILRNYAFNLSSNVVVRYGKDATFKTMNFIIKVLDDYKTHPDNGKLTEDIEIIKNWIASNSIFELTEKIAEAIENKYIFNDIVFNKNYYDGEVLNEDNILIEEPNQTMTTSFDGYFFNTDLKGNLISDDDGESFNRSTTYMEGYNSIDELLATNNIDTSSKSNPSEHIEQGKTGDDVVNVAMTEAEYKEVQRYKKATPGINHDLNNNQVRIFVRTDVWDTGDVSKSNDNDYRRMYIPVVFDVETYDSIYPLGTFFLQEDLESAINTSLNDLSGLNSDDTLAMVENSKYAGYKDFVERELAISQTGKYETNYSVTYNIDTSGEDFKTAPFSVALSEDGLLTVINDDGIVLPEEMSLEYMINNVYIPFSIPLSIDIIINQGSRVYELLQGIFYTVAFFALFIGVTIVMIAMKDIMDSNKREVSMFKAFGYSNGRATSLVIAPYLFVIILAFIVAIPFSLAFLSAVGMILTLATGATYVFALALWQWIIVIGFIIGLVIFLGFVGYKSYQHTNALEAISETNE